MAMAARKVEPALMPEEIRGRIEAEKAKHAQLTARQMELAEESIQSPQVETAYNKVMADMTACHANIERLELALASLERKNAQRLEADQLAERTALRARVAKLFDQRVPLAQKIEASVAELVRAFRDLVDLSDRVYMAWPGTQPALGAALTNAELTALLSAELFRQGHVVTVTGRPPSGRREPLPLPAPKPPSLEFYDQPEKVTPLAVAIEQANNFARNAMGS